MGDLSPLLLQFLSGLEESLQSASSVAIHIKAAPLPSSYLFINAYKACSDAEMM